jgi:hypothetical protein
MAEPRPESTLVVSHWVKLFGGIQVSPLELYALIEQCLKSRDVPDYQVSRVNWHEGGGFSAKREYLRLNRGDLDYYICAAPYGSGFFVSSRLTTPKGINWLLVVPLGVLGFLLVAFILVKVSGFFLGFLFSFGAAVAGIICLIDISKLTFYRIDTALMFQQAAHQSLMEALDQVTKLAGMAPLSDEERKPVMHELFR